MRGSTLPILLVIFSVLAYLLSFPSLRRYFVLLSLHPKSISCPQWEIEARIQQAPSKFQGDSWTEPEGAANPTKPSTNSNWGTRERRRRSLPRTLNRQRALLSFPLESPRTEPLLPMNHLRKTKPPQLLNESWSVRKESPTWRASDGDTKKR